MKIIKKEFSSKYIEKLFGEKYFYGGVVIHQEPKLSLTKIIGERKLLRRSYHTLGAQLNLNR